MIALGAWERAAWIAAGLLAMVAAGWGLADPTLYDRLIDPATVPGAFGQDAISAAAGLALVALALAGRRQGLRMQLVGLGLLGYLVYAYGIFVIERVYNPLYLVYLAVFALASWAVIIGVARIVPAGRTLTVPGTVRWTSAVVSLLQPVVFYPLWIMQLVPLMRNRDQIDSLYSIFILDLCFVMPAFLLVAVGLWRRRGWAAVTAPVVLLVGAVVMLTLALSELVKPMLATSVTVSSLLPPALLTALFAAVSVLHLQRLRQREPSRSRADDVRRVSSPDLTSQEATR